MIKLTRLLIGTYNHTPNSTGIGLCIAEFDSRTGDLQCAFANSNLINPSYSAVGSDGIIYTVSEVIDGPGTVTAFIDKDQTLTPVWTANSNGRATCHLATHPSRDLIGITNYLEGTAMLLCASNGKEIATYRYSGKGPNLKRQQSPHPHQVLFSPSGKWMLINDLGCDKIWIHDCNKPENLAPYSAIELPAGAGPRHSLFSEDGKDIYCIAELDGRLYHGRWDEEYASCHWASAQSVLPPETKQAPHCSAIRMHPKLPLIYAVDRATETLSIFSKNPSGEIQRQSYYSTGGAGPRDLMIHPSGDWLLVACQTSNAIVAHELSPETGLPTSKIKVNQFGSPVSLLVID
ncbi:lactonase family protein [Cerasicoccus maritimus]|uniref:lactonase family protein n=1 Tax=Cerasicoccus maritimus TaxID=490089 RepID=UPI002852A298|nr:beta-propeller fold lactonase family protein [Cerasicoccus maritimus]